MTTPRVPLLSPREIQIAERVAMGWIYRHIGNDLGLTGGSVRARVMSMYRKLHLKNRKELQMWVFRRLRPFEE